MWWFPRGGTIELAYEFPVFQGLSGIVLGPEGEALEDVRVFLGDWDFKIGETDAEGRFRLDAEEVDWDDTDFHVGPWNLFVLHDDHPVHWTKNVDLSRRTELRIRLLQGGTLAGRVVPPSPGAVVEIVGPLSLFCHFTEVGADGRFRSEVPLPPGSHRIRVTPPHEGHPDEKVVEIREGEETTVHFVIN